MISCKRYGHLGNQMFQIAACIGYSVKNGVPYAIPPHTESPNFQAYVFPGVQLLQEQFINFDRYQEPSFAYHEIPNYTKEGRNLLIDGFFQSEKYWCHARQEVLKAFGVVKESKNPYEKDKREVGIHVRLGDYKLYPTKHPIITIDYLKAAVMHFMELSYFKFRVFSDEPEVAWKIFEDPFFKQCRFSCDATQTPMGDMLSLSKCDHQIISNSTFGLWSYFLNQNPAKVCIAPKIWFGPDYAGNETKDIYPKNCIIL